MWSEWIWGNLGRISRLPELCSNSHLITVEGPEHARVGLNKHKYKSSYSVPTLVHVVIATYLEITGRYELYAYGALMIHS